MIGITADRLVEFLQNQHMTVKISPAIHVGVLAWFQSNWDRKHGVWCHFSDLQETIMAYGAAHVR